MEMTSIEAIKANGLIPVRDIPAMHELMRRWVDEKGFNLKAIAQMGRTKVFGELFQKFVLKQFDVSNDAIYNYFASNIENLSLVDDHDNISTYYGVGEQNQAIDKAISTSLRSLDKSFVGAGAAGDFQFGWYDGSRLPAAVQNTKIAIVGFGAAGIMVNRALYQIGFRSIYPTEKKTILGVWAQGNVYQRTRNNPRDLTFMGARLSSAPGPGQEVRDYLQTLINGSGSSAGTRDTVRIEPGNLKTKIFYADNGKEGIEYPIVINATGLGKPKPLSNRERMVTSATATSAGALRWQSTLNEDEVKGKKFILVGLGNSTAEMLRQLHTFQDRGIDTDYRILTHYPKDAVHNPDTTVQTKVKNLYKNFRVFRDLTQPNLVDYQGDLNASRHDYFRALRTDRITTDVVGWEKKEKTLLVKTKKRSNQEIQHDSLYVLTGYGHTVEEAEKMGLLVLPEEGGFVSHALYDYDGEFHASAYNLQGDTRLSKGYFGMGAILDSEYNPNAIVIPGMIFRMGDMLFSLIVRAFEASAVKK